MRVGPWGHNTHHGGDGEGRDVALDGGEEGGGVSIKQGAQEWQLTEKQKQTP